KDARDFSNAMKAQQGKLYRSVEVKLLTDEQATRDAVVQGMEWLQRQVTQHDVGMLFVAGHGANDPTLGYMFIPYNYDPQNLKTTTVTHKEFKSATENVAGKALFFIDTCHSGNVLGGRTRSLNKPDVSTVINDLASAESGVVVFSASTGRQEALENPAWGNGAFTKSLVEGLTGKADERKTGRVTHKMLDYYVTERVKELTEGKQSAVTLSPNGVPDFPLAVLR
ncbi:MAG: caspase family protein, partial [Bacteroidia bacterium]